MKKLPCKTCGKKLPLVLFDRAPLNRRRFGRSSKCKKCTAAFSKAFMKTRRGRMLYRRSWLKRNWGITMEEYDAMVARQSGLCECCGEKPKPNKQCWTGFHIDHDHRTGRIRGLLCRLCNPGLGYFKDSVERLKQAIAYLEKYANQTDTASL